MAHFYTPTRRAVNALPRQVTIRSLDAFGQGIAEINGKTLFVPQALPDERVDVKITEEKKHYAKATVIKRFNDSPQRVKPMCHHYGVCGGCQLQHASPTLQQASKLAALLHLLTRESGADLTDVQPEIIAAQPYHYRRRARLALRQQNNQLAMGFRQSSSQRIVDVMMCPVLTPELEALLMPLRALLQGVSIARWLGHVELLSVDSGVLVVIRHLRPFSATDIERLQAFSQLHDVAIYLHGDALISLTEQPAPFYRLADLELTFSPLDFIQVNGLINQQMVAKAMNWLSLTDTDYVLDLFCGMGNFSLPIATRAKQVVGVEGVSALVEKATLNSQRNNQRCEKNWLNTLFYQADLDTIASSPEWLKNSRFNKVLLDPARAGALTIMPLVAELNCAHIVYISCNPATLARDSKILIDAGYKIDQLAVLDMFPQTKHLESMVRFSQ